MAPRLVTSILLLASSVLSTAVTTLGQDETAVGVHNQKDVGSSTTDIGLFAKMDELAKESKNVLDLI